MRAFVLVVLLVLAVAGGAFVMFGEQRIDFDERYDIKVGDHWFSVPRGYLQARFGQPADEAGALRLEMVLPGLKPYSTATREAFQCLGWCDKVHAVAEPPADGVSIAERYDRMGEIEDQLRANPRLKLTDLNFSEADKGIFARLFFSEDTDVQFEQIGADFYIVECRQEKMLSSPPCQVWTDYAPGLMLSFFFHRDHLGEWPKIADTLRQRIRSFEGKGQ